MIKEKTIGKTPEKCPPNPLFRRVRNTDSNNHGRDDFNKLVHAGDSHFNFIMKDLRAHDVLKILDEAWSPGRDFKSIADNLGAGLQLHKQF